MKHLIWLLALCLPQLAHAQRAPTPEPWVMSLTYEDSWNNRRGAPGGRCEEVVSAADGAQLMRRELTYGRDGWLKRRLALLNGGVYSTEYSRDKNGRITKLLEAHGDPGNPTELRFERDPRTGQVTAITQRTEYAARGGFPASVGKKIAQWKRKPGGWTMTSRSWLDKKTIDQHTIEVEGVRPRSAHEVDLGMRWSFEYDKRGQLIAQREVDGLKNSVFTYDKRGQLIEELVMGVYYFWSYDDKNMITSLKFLERQSGARGELVASWGSPRQQLQCVVEAAPGQAGIAMQSVLWSATRSGDACGMDYNDWWSLSSLCIKGALERLRSAA